MTSHAVLITNTGFSMARHRGEQIKNLIARGWKVSTVALFEKDGVQDGRDEVLQMGAATYNLSCAASGANIRKNGTYLVQLTRLLHQLKPDVVHGFSIQAGLWGCMASRAVGVPVIVCTVTGFGYLTSGKSRLLKATIWTLARIAYRPPAELIFQNQEGLEIFVKMRIAKREQCSYIPGCGVDLSALTPNFKRPGATFVMVSRMMWSKGVGAFVDAARIVKKERPQAEFWLVGGGKADYPEQNSDFIPAAWLQERTEEGIARWLGRVSGEAAEAIMADATAVVLPSQYGEGVPRTLIEAAALGSPIITTDTPGCRDVVEDGVSGFLRDTPEQMADAMISLIDDPSRVVTMGKAARVTAAKFDTAQIMDETLNVYERAARRAA